MVLQVQHGFLKHGTLYNDDVKSPKGSLRNEDGDGNDRGLHFKIRVRVIHITTKLFYVVSR